MTFTPMGLIAHLERSQLMVTERFTMRRTERAATR